MHGVPVAGISVELLSANEFDSFVRSSTNSAGEYELQAPEPGDYLIAVNGTNRRLKYTLHRLCFPACAKGRCRRRCTRKKLAPSCSQIFAFRVTKTMRRYTRLSNGFSRKLENHAAATALNYFAYKFIKIHRTLRMSPAMAAGVTDRLWSVEDLVALWEAYEQRRAERAA
jgi:hypothetical protein